MTETVFERIERKNKAFWRLLTDPTLTREQAEAIVDEVFGKAVDKAEPPTP